MTEISSTSLAFVDPVGQKAGMDHYDAALGHCLEQAGYRVHIFSNFTSGSGRMEVNNTFHNLGPNKVPSYFSTLAGLVRSIRSCKRKKIRFVVFHFFKGGLLDWLAAALAKRSGLKAVLIVHDIHPLEGFGFRPLKKMLLRHFYHALVVHNNYSFRELSGFIGAACMKQAAVIPHINFIGLAGKSGPPVCPEGLKVTAGTRYLLFFGQLKKTKGLEVLIRAMHGSGEPYHLIIAGKSRDVSFSRFGPLISRFQLNHRVHVINRFISAAERDYLFSLAFAVVLPYRRGYQSGVMITAMSLGKVVVASDIESHREIIRPGENGLLFKSGDPAALRRVLDSLLAGQENREHLEKRSLLTMKNGHGCAAITGPWAGILGEY